MSVTASVVIGSEGAWARDADLQTDVDRHRAKVQGARGWALLSLSFSTLGVIYGDIGTSPLYAFASVFPDGAPGDDPKRTLGGFSIMFWTMTVLVLLKYVLIVLAANDHGEGGTFALYSLLRRAITEHQAGATGREAATATGAAGKGWGAKTGSKLRGWLASHLRLQHALLAFVLLAVCMVLSDGVLTPAISVVSAIEGLQSNTGISRGAVVGITCGILMVLFVSQSFGTQRISFLFSPFILLWMLSNAAIGLYNVFHYSPSTFKGLSPHYIYYFWQGDAHNAWIKLGAVMLTVTGCEALFADMGHFSKTAIQLSFTFCVYPCLTLTYLGQTAMSLERPEAAASAYWESIPSPLKWPMLVLATIATIIASQALISGAFSIVQQAASFHCFPRVTIKHTSPKVHGQVYIPEVNYLLMIGTLAVVIGFQTSSKIGNAYGLAVITVMLMTTTLATLVMLACWELNPLAAGAFWLFMTFIEAAFFSSNLEKIPSGAWFTLLLAALLFPVCYVWHWGHGLKLRYLRDNAVPLHRLLEEPESEDSQSGSAGAVLGGGASQATQLRLFGGRGPAIARVPGVGLYYNELLEDVSPVLTRFLARMPAMHQVVVLLTVRSVPIPHVPDEDHLLVRKLASGFYAVVARYGYMDRIDHGPGFVEDLMQEITAYLGITPSGITSVAVEQQLAYDDHANTWHAAPAASLAADLRRDLELARASAPQPTAHLPRVPEMGPPLEAASIARSSVTSFPWVGRPTALRKAPSSKSGSSGSAEIVAATTAPAPAGPGRPELAPSLAAERAQVQAAYRASGATYVLGQSKLVTANRKAWLKILSLEGLYALLVNNSRATPAAYHLPPGATIQLGVVYEV